MYDVKCPFLLYCCFQNKITSNYCLHKDKIAMLFTGLAKEQ